MIRMYLHAMYMYFGGEVHCRYIPGPRIMAIKADQSHSAASLGSSIYPAASRRTTQTDAPQNTSVITRAKKLQLIGIHSFCLHVREHLPTWQSFLAIIASGVQLQKRALVPLSFLGLES